MITIKVEGTGQMSNYGVETQAVHISDNYGDKRAYALVGAPNNWWFVYHANWDRNRGLTVLSDHPLADGGLTLGDAIARCVQHAEVVVGE